MLGTVHPLEGYSGIGDLIANVDGLHLHPPLNKKTSGKAQKATILLKGRKTCKNFLMFHNYASTM